MEKNNQYKCNFCNIKYKCQSERVRHEVKNHINLTKLFKCKTCNIVYDNKEKLIKHLKKHQNS
jgi:hypothetical protein